MLVPQSILTASLERVRCYDPHVLREKTETSLELLPEQTAQPLTAEHSKLSTRPPDLCRGKAGAMVPVAFVTLGTENSYLI